MPDVKPAEEVTTDTAHLWNEQEHAGNEWETCGWAQESMTGPWGLRLSGAPHHPPTCLHVSCCAQPRQRNGVKTTQEGTSLRYYSPSLSLGPCQAGQGQAHAHHGSEVTLMSFPSCRGKLGCRRTPMLPSAGGQVNWVTDLVAWCRLCRCATRPQGCLEVPAWTQCHPRGALAPEGAGKCVWWHRRWHPAALTGHCLSLHTPQDCARSTSMHARGWKALKLL